MADLKKLAEQLTGLTVLEVNELSFYFSIRADDVNSQSKRTLRRPARRRSDMKSKTVDIVDRTLMPVTGENVFDPEFAETFHFSRAPGIVQDPIWFFIRRSLWRRTVGRNVLYGNHQTFEMKSVEPRQHLFGGRLVFLGHT